MISLFQDGPEYQDRLSRPFRPTKVCDCPLHPVPDTHPHTREVTTAEIHAAIPRHLFQRSAIKSFSYVIRDVAAAYALYRFALLIDPSVLALSVHFNLGSTLTSAMRWGAWSFYWCWQGVVLAGWWCMAHDAGHGTLSDSRWVNHLIGYGLHTVCKIPSRRKKLTRLMEHAVPPRSLLFLESYPPRSSQGRKFDGT